jgi:hypothetical protein
MMVSSRRNDMAHRPRDGRGHAHILRDPKIMVVVACALNGFGPPTLSFEQHLFLLIFTSGTMTCASGLPIESEARTDLFACSRLINRHG